MNTLRFLKEFLKKGEISPRWGSLPNLASSLPYEQHLKLPQYFYLLMEKPLGCYFKVQSPYYQASVEKTIIENLASIEKISCSQNLRFFVIGCFDWKIGIFQQTVVRVYYILERNINEYSWINCVKFVCPKSPQPGVTSDICNQLTHACVKLETYFTDWFAGIYLLYIKKNHVRSLTQTEVMKENIQKSI